MEQHFWRQFAVGFFVVNTVCVIILIEVLIFGKPYISLFLLILVFTFFLNKKLFRFSRHSRNPTCPSREGGNPDY